MHTVVISVGTSLRGNYRRESAAQAARAAAPAGRVAPGKRTAPGLRPAGSSPSADVLPPVGELVAYLTRTPLRQASAESNTLEQLPIVPGDRLIWLHSDTHEGRLCAAALRDRYVGAGWEGERRQVNGLDYQEPSFAGRGLRNLVAQAFAIVREAAPHGPVEICATGGFKAEVAYLNLVGLLLGIPVHYVHERFDTLITLPSLPLQWNSDLVAAHESFFAWIEEEGAVRSTAEVEERLQAAPELRPLVVDDPDGSTLLSPSGLLLYDAFKARA